MTIWTQHLRPALQKTLDFLGFAPRGNHAAAVAERTLTQHDLMASMGALLPHPWNNPQYTPVRLVDPVHTGRLLRSFFPCAPESALAIGADTAFAREVLFGTHYHRAHPDSGWWPLPPAASARYETVLSCCMSGYSVDLVRFLTYISEHLRDGGTAWLCEPVISGWHETLPSFSPQSGFRLRRVCDWEEAAAEAGLKVRRIFIAGGGRVFDNLSTGYDDSHISLAFITLER